MASLYVELLTGTVLAAVGQVLFKLGATGRAVLVDYVNPWIVGGLLAYAAGTVLWIHALSRAPLTIVYPFTALTFVLVYIASIMLLGEQTTPKALIGVALVLAGLYCISSS